MPIVSMLCLSNPFRGNSEQLQPLGFTTEVHRLFTTDGMIQPFKNDQSSASMVHCICLIVDKVKPHVNILHLNELNTFLKTTYHVPFC